MDTEFKLFLTPDDVAAILHLSVRTITGGICRKTLPWIKVGGSLRMRREALEAYQAMSSFCAHGSGGRSRTWRKPTSGSSLSSCGNSRAGR